MTLNQSPAPSPGESAGHGSGQAPNQSPAAEPAPEPAPAPNQSSAPSTAASAEHGSGLPPTRPAGAGDNQFLFVCMGVTFFVVLMGIGIGGIRHFFPGLFANRTDAEIAAEFGPRTATQPGATPAAEPPGSQLTAPAPSAPAPVRPAGTAPATPASPAAAGSDEVVAKLRAELKAAQADAAEARARVTELERALAALQAQLESERGRREKAEIRSDEKRAADLYQQATAAAEAENFAKARVLAEAVVRLSPDHVGARGLRARAALEQGDGAAAFEDYLVAIRLDPRFGPHHRGLGRALMAMKRYPEAVQAFERALSLDPGDLKAIELRDAAAKQAKPPALPDVPGGK